MEFKPLWFADNIKVINPTGHAGIVTLWTPRDRYMRNLGGAYPNLLAEGSPLVAVTNLFGNGLPGLLVNLAHNPQIERIAVTGKNVTHTAECLVNFFERGVEPSPSVSEFARIVGTEYLLGHELSPSHFSRKPQITVFRTDDFEGVRNFVEPPPQSSPSESERVKIDLVMPAVTVFPTDLASHRVVADSILDAWMDVVSQIWKYGEAISLGFRPEKQRRLLNLSVTITKPEYESAQRLEEFGLDPKVVEDYRVRILDRRSPDELDGQDYEPGHRLREHFGHDALRWIGLLLRRERMVPNAFVSLWDNKRDLFQLKSFPCLSDLLFVHSEGKLVLQASFRNLDALHAFVPDLHSLVTVQKYVAQACGIEPGPLHVRARWIHVMPDSAKLPPMLALIRDRRKKRLDVNDPRGYFVVSVEEEKIVARHFSPAGYQLEEFRGEDAEDIKSKLRYVDAFSSSDHAIWFGGELARAEIALKERKERNKKAAADPLAAT